jgi:hypothetical protein
MEALSSSETSVLTRATWRNIQEDIRHSHCHENLKSYILGVLISVQTLRFLRIPSVSQVSLPCTFFAHYRSTGCEVFCSVEEALLKGQDSFSHWGDSTEILRSAWFFNMSCHCCLFCFQNHHILSLLWITLEYIFAYLEKCRNTCMYF